MGGNLQWRDGRWPAHAFSPHRAVTAGARLPDDTTWAVFSATPAAGSELARGRKPFGALSDLKESLWGN